MTLPILASWTEAATDGNTTQTTLTLNTPSGVQVGDLLVIIIGNDDNTTTAQWDNSTNKPTGFTLLQEAGDANADTHGAVFWKWADGSEGASIDVPCVTSTDLTGAYLRITGADPTTPFDVPAGTAYVSNTSGNSQHVIPSITTSVNDCLAFYFVIADGSDTLGHSVDNGFTEVSEIGAGTNNTASTAMSWGTKAVSSAGATGDATVTYTVDDGATGWQFAVAGLSAGISSVTPSEFDYDAGSVDLAGAAFGATQGSSTVYISDADTLAGSANEVDITTAITSWGDAAVNLDLSLLDQSTQLALSQLGVGSMFVIMLVGGATEYSSAITTHRAKVFQLSASANIGTGGTDNTTAQLTPPTGKTTGDFGGGKISDDTNPSGAVDIAADTYREDEFCLEALLTGFNSSVYQFRLLVDGLPVDTTTVTPQMTFVLEGYVFPSAGLVTFTGQVPTPTLSDNKLVQVPAGTVTFAGSVPTVNIAPSPRTVLANFTGPNGEDLTGVNVQLILVSDLAGGSITVQDNGPILNTNGDISFTVYHDDPVCLLVDVGDPAIPTGFVGLTAPITPQR